MRQDRNLPLLEPDIGRSWLTPQTRLAAHMASRISQEKMGGKLERKMSLETEPKVKVEQEVSLSSCSFPSAVMSGDS